MWRSDILNVRCLITVQKNTKVIRARFVSNHRSLLELFITPVVEELFRLYRHSLVHWSGTEINVTHPLYSQRAERTPLGHNLFAKLEYVHNQHVWLFLLFTSRIKTMTYLLGNSFAQLDNREVNFWYWMLSWIPYEAIQRQQRTISFCLLWSINK